MQDYGEAAKWIQLAAEQGNPEAQLNLGFMYSEGHGVTQDDGEAAKWFRLAAEQGNPKAQGNLGVMYSEGQGVPRDVRRAYSLLSRAASSLSGADAQMVVKYRDAVAKQLTRPTDETTEAKSAF